MRAKMPRIAPASSRVLRGSERSGLAPSRRIPSTRQRLPATSTAAEAQRAGPRANCKSATAVIVQVLRHQLGQPEHRHRHAVVLYRLLKHIAAVAARGDHRFRARGFDLLFLYLECSEAQAFGAMDRAHPPPPPPATDPPPRRG